MPPALPPLCLFGTAGSDKPSLAGFVYKLMGRGTTEDDYTLFLEVSNAAVAYVSKFSLKSLIEAVEEEAFVDPGAANMMDWLRQHFEAAEVEADVSPDGGLQLSALHKWGSYDITIRLPPGGPMPAETDPRRVQWVVQELLFTQARRFQDVTRKLHDCEQRCPEEQQFDDLMAFVGESGALAARGEDGGPASPVGPRAAHIVSKRKQEAAAAAAGSAVKAARHDAPAAAGAATQASTQQSPASRKSGSTVGQPKVAKGGRGGRGGGGSVTGFGRGARRK